MKKDAGQIAFEKLFSEYYRKWLIEYFRKKMP